MLPTSTVMPLRVRITSSGRIAVPEIEFSTQPIAHHKPHRQVRLHDHSGKAEHGGGAAHVLLHPQHAAGRLDVVAAGIETDALAAQRNERRIGVRAHCRTSGGWRRAALVPNRARPRRRSGYASSARMPVMMLNGRAVTLAKRQRRIRRVRQDRAGWPAC